MNASNQDNDHAASAEGGEPASGSEDSSRVESPGTTGVEGSDQQPGQESPRDPSSLGLQEGKGSPDSPGDHLRERHHPRVYTQEDFESLEAAIQEAFSKGEPEAVWKEVQALVSASKNLVRDAAKDRFKANFGKEICNHCDGLKAGPDVVSTCFQLKQCYYSNVKSRTSPKQSKLISLLTKK